jgi:chromosome segregation ATPase
MSSPGGSQEEVKFYEEQCRLQDEHVSKLKSEIESLKAKLQTAEFFQNKWSAESEKLLKDNTELKAKLGQQDVLIYNLKQLDKSMDANVNAYVKELESKLAAESWHDASELPTETIAEYETLEIKTSGGKTYNHYDNADEVINWIDRRKRAAIEYPFMPAINIFWRKITLPEGK